MQKQPHLLQFLDFV